MAADHADIRVPPECREMIRAGALLAINTSGGKDSQAMTILLSRIVPRDQLVAVHAPLGEVEWPDTMDFIRVTLPPGMPLILAPVASGKTLLDSIEERGRFPSCPFYLLHRPSQRRLGFPGRFHDITAAIAFCRTFFPWYNTEHRHGGIAMLTPDDVHHNRTQSVLEQRGRTLQAAWTRHPERFVRGIPQPDPLPQAVWINPPVTPTTGETAQ